MINYSNFIGGSLTPNNPSKLHPLLRKQGLLLQTRYCLLATQDRLDKYKNK